MTTRKEHYRRHLAFRTNKPENRDIVRWFLARISETGVVSAVDKNVAIGRWGLYDTCAGLNRAFRVFRRTHHFGLIRHERIYPMGSDRTAPIYGYIPD